MVCFFFFLQNLRSRWMFYPVCVCSMCHCFSFLPFSVKKFFTLACVTLSPLLALGTLAILCLKTQGVGHSP